MCSRLLPPFGSERPSSKSNHQVYHPVLRPNLGIWYLDCPPPTELLQSCRFIENEASACIAPRRLLGEVTLLLSVKAGIKQCIISAIARTMNVGVFYDEIEKPSRKRAGDKNKLGSFVQTMAVEPFLKMARRCHDRHDGSTAIWECGREATHVQQADDAVEDSVAAARKFWHVSLLRMRKRRAIRVRMLVGENDSKVNRNGSFQGADVEHLYEALYTVALEFREHCESIETSYTVVCTDSSVMNQARTTLNNELKKRSSTYVHWIWFRSLVESLNWEIASEQERNLALEVVSDKKQHHQRLVFPLQVAQSP